MTADGALFSNQCFLSCYPQNNKKGLGVLNQEFEDSF